MVPIYMLRQIGLDVKWNAGEYSVDVTLPKQTASKTSVDARSVAFELLELRKTRSKADYSVQNALRDLGIPANSTPTLATLKQAVKLISLR
jgi:hypothetical protein